MRHSIADIEVISGKRSSFCYPLLLLVCEGSIQPLNLVASMMKSFGEEGVEYRAAQHVAVKTLEEARPQPRSDNRLSPDGAWRTTLRFATVFLSTFVLLGALHFLIVRLVDPYGDYGAGRFPIVVMD